jgi:hypothetical protein
MRVITIAELEAKCGAALEDRLNSDVCDEHKVTFRTSREVGSLNALAKELAHVVNSTSGSTLIARGMGVFRASENVFLAESFRRAFGESRTIREAPVHVFEADDGDACWSMTSLCLFNPWDFLLFAGDQNILIEGSHDEWVSLHATGAADLRMLRDALRPPELAELRPKKAGKPWDDALLEKLRVSLKNRPDDLATRIALAQELSEASINAGNAKHPERSDAFLTELAQLWHRFPEDEKIRYAYGVAIVESFHRAFEGEHWLQCQSLLERLRQVAVEQPQWAQTVAGLGERLAERIASR